MVDSIPVIVNGSAGGGHADSLRRELEVVFRSAGLEAHVVTARSGEDLSAIVERTVRDKPASIVAGGGDGTVSAVAAAVTGTGIALGVLPLGTLNHFAKDVGIPLDLQEAAHTIARGHSIEVDVGQVNGHVFLNNSSLGLYPHIVRDREHRQRLLGQSKWWALLEATWNALRRSPLLHLRVCLDEVEQRYASTFVFIGNNEYVMEGLNIGERRRLDTGRLSLYITQRRSRMGLLMLGVRALTGHLGQAEDFDAKTAQTIIVETRRKHVHVATDGEVNLMDTPLEYRVRPRALRVFTSPRAAQPT